MGFSGGSEGKESICNVGDLGSIPGLGRSLEEGMATHSSILAWRIPMDRRAWRATLHGVAKSWMQLSTHGFCLRTNDMKMVNGIGLRVYF